MKVRTHGEDVAGENARECVGEPGAPKGGVQAPKEDSLPLVSNGHFGEAGAKVRGKKGGRRGKGCGLDLLDVGARGGRVSSFSLKACQREPSKSDQSKKRRTRHGRTRGEGNVSIEESLATLGTTVASEPRPDFESDSPSLDLARSQVHAGTEPAGQRKGIAVVNSCGSVWKRAARRRVQGWIREEWTARAQKVSHRPFRRSVHQIIFNKSAVQRLVRPSPVSFQRVGRIRKIWIGRFWRETLPRARANETRRTKTIEGGKRGSRSRPHLHAAESSREGTMQRRPLRACNRAWVSEGRDVEEGRTLTAERRRRAERSQAHTTHPSPPPSCGRQLTSVVHRRALIVDRAEYKAGRVVLKCEGRVWSGADRASTGEESKAETHPTPWLSVRESSSLSSSRLDQQQ